jgi:uncharacterized protein YjdB
MKCIKFVKILAITALAGIIFSSCASFWYGVNIRTNNNISSVLAGGTINLRSSGRDIEWKVSSTSDGSGPVSNGTFITQNGILTVDLYESSYVLYVIARSLRDNFFDIRQIRIATVNEVSITPLDQTIAVGRTLQFKAQVTGSNNPDNAVTWKVSAASSGTGTVTPGTGISVNGTLSVASNEALRTLYITAVSVIDPSKSAVTSVSIVVPVVTSVTVSAAEHIVTAGNTLQFFAEVSGTYDPSDQVTWKVSSNAAGTGAVTPGTQINASGLLTVADSESVPALFIFAASVADPLKYGSISVTVNPAPAVIAQKPAPLPIPLAPSKPIPTPAPQPSAPAPPQQQPPAPAPPAPAVPTVTGVSINPSTYSARTNTNIQFSAAVTGTGNPGQSVTWRVSSTPDGIGEAAPRTTVNSSGNLTVAPNEWNATLYVIAVSSADPSKTGIAVVTIAGNNASQGSNQGR